MIDQTSLQTLLPNSYIDDNIINAFAKIIKENTAETEPLIFDPLFITSLTNDTEKYGFMKWAQKVKSWSHKLWLVPRCENAHWTLIVVVFPTKEIIYLDSMHGKLPKTFLRKFCGFVEKLFSTKNIPLCDWEDWVLY